MEELWKAKQKVLALKSNLEKKSALFNTYREICTRENRLIESIKKEQRDVDILHGFTLTSIVETVKRTKSLREKKEVDELNQVKQEYEDLLKEKATLLQTLDVLEKECALEKEIIQEYDNKFNDVLTQCTKMTDSLDDKLKTYKQALDELTKDQKKCLESISLNQKIQGSLSDIILTLQDAMVYSSLEVTGGDIWAKTLKEERFCASKDKVKEVKHLIDHYKVLIADLSLKYWFSIEYRSLMLSYSESQFECFFASCPLHSEIPELQEVIKNIINTYMEQNDILSKCKEDLLNEMTHQKSQIESFIFQMPLSS